MTSKLKISDLIELNPKVNMTKGLSYQFIEMAAITAGKFGIDKEKVSMREFKGSGSKFCNGDILLARITPCFENGKVALVNGLDGAAHGSTEFIVVRPKYPELASLIYALFRSDSFRIYAIPKMVGSSGRQRLPNDAVRDYPQDLPSLDELMRMGNLLSGMENLGLELSVINTTLEFIAQTLFRSWFVNFDPVHAKAAGQTPEGMSPELAALFPSEFVESELGMIPKGWNVSAFGDAFEIKGGGTPSTSESQFWEDGSYLWATPKDLSALDCSVIHATDRRITLAGVNKISSKQLPVNSVLMSSRAPVGYLAIAKEPISINQGFIAIPPSPHFPASMIYCLLHESMEQIKGNAGGSTFAEISKSAFRPIKFVAPSKTVCQAYGRIVEPIFDSISMNSRSIKSLERIRDELLPRLISGKLRIEEAEEAVSEVLGSTTEEEKAA